MDRLRLDCRGSTGLRSDQRPSDAYEKFGDTATGRQIHLWQFDDAPKIWKDLSTNGGDEDWLALIPLGMDVPGFMYEGGPFACCRLERFVLPIGDTVVIGSHA